ncbi:epimerase [Virgisporangium aliadipatigenens]|uniref:Epimerase n=1 Tax=Virgisporangium aliadipatigenens TaxID=741659 RepID=A0A8J3YW76_9ACTN|nr:NAD-dependent epimerase/dehydratase family protein [Virgisporangium aliadipatigenens]GIJ51678.1 epimerase [Virgisporangium aliadipatigenens]
MNGWAITGGSGFLGWHTRVLARALGWPEPVVLQRADLVDPDRLAALLTGVDLVVHVAGVNRGDPTEVAAGNMTLGSWLAAGIERVPGPPPDVVYANSVQADNGTPYGDAKAFAAATLAKTTTRIGAGFRDVRLPNLFGEHGKPFYNSVVATFCRVYAEGGQPSVGEDRKLELLHATDAASLLLGTSSTVESRRMHVGELAERIGRFAAVYAGGEMPVLLDRFDVRLFNTFRSHLPVVPRPLPTHADARGELVETVKAHGGPGQSFCSSTVPGATRGQHYHLHKIERFVVVSGEAEIRLRRVLHDDVVTLRVSGREPVAVDMPALWAHSITNVGGADLITLFWANEVFDPARPDTYREIV